MPEHVESVKQVVRDLNAWAIQQDQKGNSSVSAKMKEMARVVEDASDEMVRLYGLTTALPPDLGNIHDLPKELLDELSVAKTDELEDQIVAVINAYGGEASLDQILVGLFRKFQVVQKRRFLQNKLYRMTMVWSVEGRKGIYTLTEPTPADSDDEIDAGYFDTPASDDMDEIPF